MEQHKNIIIIKLFISRDCSSPDTAHCSIFCSSWERQIKSLSPRLAKLGINLETVEIVNQLREWGLVLTVHFYCDLYCNCTLCLWFPRQENAWIFSPSEEMLDPASVRLSPGSAFTWSQLLMKMRHCCHWSVSPCVSGQCAPALTKSVSQLKTGVGESSRVHPVHYNHSRHTAPRPQSVEQLWWRNWFLVLPGEGGGGGVTWWSER